MANKFTMPEIIYTGEGALEAAKEDLAKLGSHALIVTGKSMIRQGKMSALTDVLDEKKTAYTIYSEISGEPTDKMIEAGLALYKDKGCDFVIGFGGGSPLDSAKAIAAMVAHPGKISDYNGVIMTEKIPPVVEIPSTSGTGSEVTQFTIISDTEKDIKMLLKGSVLMPVMAIAEPEFTYRMPKSVTAATGLDALTHAVEAYTSKKAFPMTDIYAKSAVKKIFKYLPRAYRDGKDMEARNKMSEAALEAGISFNNSSVTIVHGMSRPIGALFHVPHGISNAMLLKECMAFALSGACDRFAELARAIGAADETEGDKEAAFSFLAAIDELCKVCEVPTLQKYGIDKNAFFEKIDKMAQDAYDSGSPSNTRRETGIEDMKAIYKRLWE